MLFYWIFIFLCIFVVKTVEQSSVEEDFVNPKKETAMEKQQCNKCGSEKCKGDHWMTLCLQALARIGIYLKVSELKFVVQIHILQLKK